MMFTGMYTWHMKASCDSTRRTGIMERIGFIGVGQRTQRHYMPLSSACGFTHVGFYSRSDRSDVASRWCRQYASASELATDVDVLIVCIPSDEIVHLLASIVKDCHRLPYFVVETPATHALASFAQCNPHVRIAVAENWPLRTWNVIARDVVTSGLLGRVNVVVNDFRGYEYHGYAMMRQLASHAGSTSPVSAFGMSWSTGDVLCQTGVLRENWDVGCIELASGVRLINNFNSIHSRSHARGPRSMRILCEHGAVWGDDAVNFGVTHERSGEVTTVIPSVTRDETSGNVTHVAVELSGTKFEVECDPRFDDESMSVVRMLEGIRSGRWNYSVADASCDVNCVNALRHSSHMGCHVRFNNITV